MHGERLLSVSRDQRSPGVKLRFVKDGQSRAVHASWTRAARGRHQDPLLVEPAAGLEPEQVARLLASCNEFKVAGRRDRAILMLLARMGLRAGEVAALELEHFDWSRGEVVIPGKGGRHDRLPLPADVGEALASYILGGRPKFTTGRLFLRVQAPQGSISVESVKEVVRRACRRVGIPSVGPHCLRHGVASQALAAGASLAEVGQLLRHRDLSTTAIYGKVDRTRLRELARPWSGATP